MHDLHMALALAKETLHCSVKKTKKKKEQTELLVYTKQTRVIV